MGLYPADQLRCWFRGHCKRFNHQSPAVTMRYLGITDKEVENILVNNEVG
jgi:hypothetical protein